MCQSLITIKDIKNTKSMCQSLKSAHAGNRYARRPLSYCYKTRVIVTQKTKMAADPLQKPQSN